MASGIDVSHWQGTIDWKQVAASKKADFAIIKATEGTGFTDQRFHDTGVAAQRGKTTGITMPCAEK